MCIVFCQYTIAARHANFQVIALDTVTRAANTRLMQKNYFKLSKKLSN